MAGGHTHGHHELDQVPVPRRARLVVLGFLALAALVTVIGLMQLWPDSTAVDHARGDVQFAAPGVTFPHARITHVLPPCDPRRSMRPPRQVRRRVARSTPP
jgi:hypothetical protein